MSSLVMMIQQNIKVIFNLLMTYSQMVIIDLSKQVQFFEQEVYLQFRLNWC